MYSSVRCTFPPVVSPMQTAGMPAAIGTLASVLEASKLGSSPRAASAFAATWTMGLSTGTTPAGRSPIGSRLNLTDAVPIRLCPLPASVAQ